MPQGLKSACVLAIFGLDIILTAHSLKLFQALYKINPAEMGGETNPLNIIIKYLDDILICSPKHLGVDTHILWIKYFFFVMVMSGLKINLKKSNFMVKKFTFLGVNYDLRKETIFIQDEKLAVIETFRSPRSKAELFSRMSSFNYY